MEGMECPRENDSQRFERIVLPHLNPAYNLARWLMHQDQDAEDAVQEAYLRAWKFFDRFQGEDARAWLLKIVRNTCYTRLKTKQTRHESAPFDEEIHSDTNQPKAGDPILENRSRKALLNQALEKLPVDLREVIVLHELEGFSYKEIAELCDIPIGTVMSRLAARAVNCKNCWAIA